jgi:hypothetical protein
MPVGVDGLAEVAMAIEEPDADERKGHVGGRLAMVPTSTPRPPE